MILRTPGGWSVRVRGRALAVGAACVLAALAFAVVAIGSGDYPMSPAAVVRTLAGYGSAADAFIVEQVRLPRVLTGLLTGAALGLSGALFQSLVRNPLGSPDLLGFTQGAAAGALAAVMVGGGSVVLMGGAVAGGVVTGAVIYALSWRQGVHGYRLVLVGIGVAAILTGVNGYLLTRANIPDATRAVLWLTGSLNGRGWNDVVPLLVAVAVAVPAVLLGGGRGLRMLEMGDETACALGVRVERLRLMLLAAAVLLASFAAGAAGPVSFVALTAPQLARRLTADPGPNLAASLCMGAALLTGADLAGQRIVPGHQLPVGVLTGVLGGGYLLWLLATQQRGAGYDAPAGERPDTRVRAAHGRRGTERGRPRPVVHRGGRPERLRQVDVAARPGAHAEAPIGRRPAGRAGHPHAADAGRRPHARPAPAVADRAGRHHGRRPGRPWPLPAPAPVAPVVA
jgi:iron complex transport system permease protein